MRAASSAAVVGAGRAPPPVRGWSCMAPWGGVRRRGLGRRWGGSGAGGAHAGGGAAGPSPPKSIVTSSPLPLPCGGVAGGVRRRRGVGRGRLGGLGGVVGALALAHAVVGFAVGEDRAEVAQHGGCAHARAVAVAQPRLGGGREQRAGRSCRCGGWHWTCRGRPGRSAARRRRARCRGRRRSRRRRRRACGRRSRAPSGRRASRRRARRRPRRRRRRRGRRA